MPGISLGDKQAISRALLRCGANIGEINTVRRHLSAIKGGRLAAACAPAQVVSLLISDVPGDKPIDIASGPTVGDPSTCADALAIVKRYGIDMPAAALACLQSGQGESVKPHDPRLQRNQVHIVASPQIALEAAARVIALAGLRAHILSDAIEGEARDVGQVMAAMAVQVAERGQPFAAPCVLLSGGETTVTVTGDGRGGRNVEFLLSLGVASQGHARIHALAADTDGQICQAYGTWVEKSMYGKTYMGVERATFLIDPDGKIAAIWRNVKVDGHVQEVLAKARQLRQADAA
jgi:hydroxypyruvate reductase